MFICVNLLLLLLLQCAAQDAVSHFLCYLFVDGFNFACYCSDPFPDKGLSCFFDYVYCVPVRDGAFYVKSCQSCVLVSSAKAKSSSFSKTVISFNFSSRRRAFTTLCSKTSINYVELSWIRSCLWWQQQRLLENFNSAQRKLSAFSSRANHLFTTTYLQSVLRLDFWCRKKSPWLKKNTYMLLFWQLFCQFEDFKEKKSHKNQDIWRSAKQSEWIC